MGPSELNPMKCLSGPKMVPNGPRVPKSKLGLPRVRLGGFN